MRTFISMVMILALVIATTMAPATSHAMPYAAGKAVHTAKTEPAKGHDCHREAEADSQKTAQNDKDASGKCCDKGMCKCLGGNCHNLSKYLDDSSDSFGTLSSSANPSGFEDRFVDSAMSDRLKRPPRA